MASDPPAIVVPLNWIRPESITKFDRERGYVALDRSADDGHLLTDSALQFRIYASLTVGSLSGQDVDRGNDIDFDFVCDVSRQTLRQQLNTWCIQAEMEGSSRLTLHNIVSLAEFMAVPYQFGQHVVRWLLVRILARVAAMYPFLVGAGGDLDESLLDDAVTHISLTAGVDEMNFYLPSAPSRPPKLSTRTLSPRRSPININQTPPYPPSPSPQPPPPPPPYTEDTEVIARLRTVITQTNSALSDLHQTCKREQLELHAHLVAETNAAFEEVQQTFRAEVAAALEDIIEQTNGALRELQQRFADTA